jgi:hypothetical protein
MRPTTNNLKFRPTNGAHARATRGPEASRESIRPSFRPTHMGSGRPSTFNRPYIGNSLAGRPSRLDAAGRQSIANNKSLTNSNELSRQTTSFDEYQSKEQYNKTQGSNRGGRQTLHNKN